MLPSGNVSALLKQWDYEGFQRISFALMGALGCAIVVLRDPADEAGLMAAFEMEVCGAE